MHDNQIWDEGQAKYQSYVYVADCWRRARNPGDKSAAKPIASIRRLGLAWASAINQLIGR